MSYPMDLDDYTSSQLRNELARRDRLMRAGLCPYCEQPLTLASAHGCKWAGNAEKYHQPLVIVPEPHVLNTEGKS